MTAITEFERLEAPALWRADSTAQKQEVIVSVGEATLTLTDNSGAVLAHWSLPAIERINPDETPARYRPAADSDEELEVDDDLLIEAIARVRKAIDRNRPRPGRLRSTIFAGLALGAFGLGVFWLPNALINHATTIVPDVTRTHIGEGLLIRIERLSGRPCRSEQGDIALRKLSKRLLGNDGSRIVVLGSGIETSQHLPGDILLLGRGVVEGHDLPDAPAGFVLAEAARAQAHDPLERLLREAGFMAALRLLTTGDLPADTLDTHAEALLTQAQETPDFDSLIPRFEAAQLAASPYAYALDITGETVLPLIEADTIQIKETRPVLSDSDWVALQGICGG